MIDSFFSFLASLCVKQDGLADSSLIRNWDIKVSSNEEHKTDIRPGAKGWTPEAGDKKTTVDLFVGDALIYGANMRLLTSKCVGKYDVLLSGGEQGNVQKLKVSYVKMFHYTALLIHQLLLCRGVRHLP